MTDMYVYFFMRTHGPQDQKVLSKRRATLDAIRNMGEPVMESQIVVDHTEVDGNGFLTGGVDDQLHPTDERWAEIRSLERRAESRADEARQLSDITDGPRKYMLSLEIRELRKEAQRLKKHRADAMADEFGAKFDGPVFSNLMVYPNTG
jgi:hypothetical protein